MVGRNTSHYLKANRCAARLFYTDFCPLFKLARKGRGDAAFKQCILARPWSSGPFTPGQCRATGCQSVPRCTCLLPSSPLAASLFVESPSRWLQYIFYRPPIVLQRCCVSALIVPQSQPTRSRNRSRSWERFLIKLCQQITYKKFSSIPSE
jgi:hypothetical protein